MLNLELDFNYDVTIGNVGTKDNFREGDTGIVTFVLGNRIRILWGHSGKKFQTANWHDAVVVVKTEREALQEPIPAIPSFDDENLFVQLAAHLGTPPVFHESSDGHDSDDSDGGADYDTCDQSTDPTHEPDEIAMAEKCDVFAVNDTVDQAEAEAEAAAAAAEEAEYAKNKLRVEKFQAPEIKLGNPQVAIDGVAKLMDVNEHELMAEGKELQAIKDEFSSKGTDDDKENLKHVLEGTYRGKWRRAKSQSVTVEALLQTKQAVTAKLQWHHILALRLYTTSSYCRINNPLREDPQNHPFPATVLFITEALKKLRALEWGKPGTKRFYRGIQGKLLPEEFGKTGGTEYACMSTSTDLMIAIEFATKEDSSCTSVIFEYTSSSFVSRGADISFLSVYPEEKETLYPPLIFLEPKSMSRIEEAIKITFKELGDSIETVKELRRLTLHDVSTFGDEPQRVESNQIQEANKDVQRLMRRYQIMRKVIDEKVEGKEILFVEVVPNFV